jgi:hypothetical protein
MNSAPEGFENRVGRWVGHHVFVWSKRHPNLFVIASIGFLVCYTVMGLHFMGGDDEGMDRGDWVGLVIAGLGMAVSILLLVFHLYRRSQGTWEDFCDEMLAIFGD